MKSDRQTNYIELKTDFDVDFKVTILSQKGMILFSQNMSSNNRKIVLKGFTLKEHTVMLAPIHHKNNT
ncbi:hypothetical protein [Winogradskyella psychrotolerans]|uniref:hypothetical protein n=1 Tax=Winogradskyella psychrotolerans TaxID=1344585 RepID=UPI001C079E36|nr:hypothetical protein [Winogradskyella psychrotolerans]MBU2926985.1 hypothetical protein [Winogradskyella psychrotolerans]